MNNKTMLEERTKENGWYATDELEGLSQEERKNVKYIYGDNAIILENYPNLETIEGNAGISGNAKVPNLKIINGRAAIYNHISLPNLEKIGGEAYLFWGVSAPKLTTTGGKTRIYNNVNVPKLRRIYGEAFIHTEASVPNLERIDGYAIIYANAYVPNLLYIGEWAVLYEGVDVYNLQYIGGNATLYNGAYAPSLTTIGRCASLFSRTVATNLETIGDLAVIDDNAEVPKMVKNPNGGGYIAEHLINNTKEKIKMMKSKFKIGDKVISYDGETIRIGKIVYIKTKPNNKYLYVFEVTSAIYHYNAYAYEEDVFLFEDEDGLIQSVTQRLKKEIKELKERWK